MNTDSSSLVDSGLSQAVLGAFYSVYRDLGYGFLEAVYERALVVALTDAGLVARRQVPIGVRFRGVPVGHYRADVLVADRLLVEVKSATMLVPAHDAQLLNYLRATGIRLGLLLNFGPRPQFRRKIH